MNKTCLILGGGSKFGRHLTENFLDQGYKIRLVTATPDPWTSHAGVEVVAVDWKTIAIQDLGKITAGITAPAVIFFNQNSSALSMDNFNSKKIQSPQHWQQNYFVACQLPFYIVQIMRAKFQQTKVTWMLSSLIKNPQLSQIGYADYVGNKFTNYCIMKAFSLTSNNNEAFFAMHPDGIAGTADSLSKAQNMVSFIDQTAPTQLNGQVFSHLGQPMYLT